MLQMEQDTGFVPDLGTKGVKRELDVQTRTAAVKRESEAAAAMHVKLELEQEAKPTLSRRLSRRASQVGAELALVKLEAKDEDKEASDHRLKLSLETEDAPKGSTHFEPNQEARPDLKLELKDEAGMGMLCVMPVKTEAEWGYAARVPLWVEQCLAFQKARRT